MQSLLALHTHLSTSDLMIANVAARRGWSIVQPRYGEEGAVMRDVAAQPPPMLRYYGNTRRRAFRRTALGIAYYEVDLAVLTTLGWATNRDITLMRLIDLPQPLTAARFVKPARGKWFKSRVYGLGEVIEPLEDDLPANDLIYVSHSTGFITEVRTWCLDGEIMTSSIYRGHPEQRINLAPIAHLVSLLHGTHDLPRSIVMDFGQLWPGDDWSLIEFNKPWASDLYRADPERCFDCVVASQSGFAPVV